MSAVTVETDGAVATVTIRRPEKLNALDAGVIGELQRAFSALDAPEAGVRCAVLTGEGKAFVAGADIAAMAELSPIQAREFAAAGHRLGATMEGARFPIIAAVNGFALGGGLELALACDFIYASERAKLGLPETTLAVIPGFGGTQRLPRRVGVGRARELIYTGRVIKADEALAWGIVNRVLPPDTLLDEVRATAQAIVANGPLAVAAAKRVMHQGMDADLTVASELEGQAFAGLFGSDDQRAGMRAFVAKTKADFVGK
ncbi:MAG: enoyl-CoA hydratase-related protein [Myxococcota bacterium]